MNIIDWNWWNRHIRGRLSMVDWVFRNIMGMGNNDFVYRWIYSGIIENTICDIINDGFLISC